MKLKINLPPSVNYALSLAVIFFVYGHSLIAQKIISGQIENADGDPVPFANVMILEPADSSLKKGSLSNQHGKYEIESDIPGKFLISASMVGYRTSYASVDISAHSTEKKEINLVLSEDLKLLNEVVVNAQKPLFEKEIDRMIVNVRSSVLSSGSTALEILERSPGIIVNRQNNSLSLNGKNNVLVMINDKETRLPIDAVLQMLDGMNSANIENIELITTPPASYDAEGDAGIINIVLIEDADQGTNGNFGIGAGFNWAEILKGNFSFNHRKKKIGIFLNYDINYDRTQHKVVIDKEINRREYISRNTDLSIRNPKITVQNIRTGFEYSLSDKTTAGILLTAYQRVWDMEATNEDINQVNADSTVYTDVFLEEINKWRSFTGNIGIDHRFNKDNTLLLDFDYLYYHNDNPSVYVNEFHSLPSGSRSQEDIDVTKNTPIKFLVGKIDYLTLQQQPFKIEIGAKATSTRFENAVEVNRFSKQIWEKDTALSNFSTLTEFIGAGYFSFAWEIDENWKINGGLRYEYTDSYLTSPGRGALVDREYGYLFPSVFIVRNLTDNSTIQTSYSRRITRPTFNEMAPFVLFFGPNIFFSGNTAIRPALSDAIELSYQLKSWFVSLTYTATGII
jgi:outer membrane receptor protein involved in Fe transport